MSKSGKGYTWPNPIDPEDSICIKVFVPNDPLYIGQFWRAYEFFGEWIAWERDDAHTGKDVAAVWKSYITVARNMFLENPGCEGTEMPFDMRVDPERPYVSQVSVDGGVNWHDAILQPHWGSSTIVPDTSSDKAAQNVTETVMLGFIERIIKMISDGVNLSEPADTTVTRVVDSLMGSGAGATIRPTIQGLYDAYAGLTGPEQAAYTADDCKYALYAQHIKTSVQDNPSWLSSLSSTIVDGLGLITDPVLSLFGPLGELLDPNVIWNFSGGSSGTRPQLPFASGPFSSDCDILFNGHPIRAIGPIFRSWHAAQNQENTTDTGVCLDIIDGYELVAAVVKVEISGNPSNWYYRAAASPSCVGGVATSFGHAGFIQNNGGCGVACAGVGYDLVWEEFGITDLFNILQNNAFASISGPAIRSFWGGVGNQNSDPAGMDVSERWHFFVRTDA